MRYTAILLAIALLSGCIGIPEKQSAPTTTQTSVPATTTLPKKIAAFDCSNEKGSLADFCYVKQAKREGSISACETIKAAHMKAICIAIITKDPGICESFSSSFDVASCKAMAEDDLAQCEALATQNEKDLCYFGVGGMWSSREACDKVFNQDTKIGCINLAAWYTKE